MKHQKDVEQFRPEIEKIAKMLREAKYAICLTGAGISTDSGIPDFRSPKTGLWNQKDAQVLTEPKSFDKAMEFFWKIGYKIGKILLKAKPNKGHMIIAKWENERGIVKAVITQNVDRLHQKAGSKNVVELHGNAFEATCPFCRGTYSMKELMSIYKASGRKPPTCMICSSPVKPNVVLFGDPMPRGAMDSAMDEIRQCDVAILLGSSSVVYPANYLPVLVHEKGGKVIIVNEMKTDLDQIAEVVVNGSISHVLEKIDQLLSSP
nr:NAD-dependent deacylase [Candidatus Sigynarchaeota archaeon]